MMMMMHLPVRRRCADGDRPSAAATVDRAAQELLCRTALRPPILLLPLNPAAHRSHHLHKASSSSCTTETRFLPTSPAHHPRPAGSHGSCPRAQRAHARRGHRHRRECSQYSKRPDREGTRTPQRARPRDARSEYLTHPRRYQHLSRRCAHLHHQRIFPNSRFLRQQMHSLPPPMPRPAPRQHSAHHSLGYPAWRTTGDMKP